MPRGDLAERLRAESELQAYYTTGKTPLTLYEGLKTPLTL